MIGYIYQIKNLQNNKIYIGKTINIVNRRNEHFNDLKTNTHVNKRLQNDYNKYGKDNFEFTYKAYEIEDASELNQLEIDTIEKYNSFKDGYNLTLGGDGGNTRGKLSYEDYCFIYLGCQWQGYTEKVGRYLGIGSSAVSAIIRDKAYLWYKDRALSEPQEVKDNYVKQFREVFNIQKPEDENRVSTHLTEDEYFYCFCVAAIYSRGIESSLAKYFGKHKSFLSNNTKGKQGKGYMALQRFKRLTDDEVFEIATKYFNEWNIQSYSKTKLYVNIHGGGTNKWIKLRENPES